MSRQTVLISSLGESPAVVTEAIDKLEQEEKISFTQVVTLGTHKYEVRQSAEILSEHIPAHYSKRIAYVPAYIQATDVNSERDNLDYLAEMAELLRSYRHLGDVYVSIAGGRKTMSALVALAVQIYGAKLLCHVINMMVEMDEALQRRMQASYLKRYPEEWSELLHPSLEELTLVRLPVISLFPMLDDFLAALGGQSTDRVEKSALLLLENGGLIKKSDAGWDVTETGKTLYGVLSDVESLPPPSTTPPEEKKVNIADHHGKDELLPHAERLRKFVYAERIVSTDWNSQFDRSRAVQTRYGRLLIETQPGCPDILRLTLDNRRGCALDIYTTAKTAPQAERLKKKLEHFLSGKD